MVEHTTIQLIRMRADDFAAFKQRTIHACGQGRALAGEWSAQEAPGRAAADFAQQLPAGLATPGNHLFVLTVAEDGRAVGDLWLAEHLVGKHKVAVLRHLHVGAADRQRGFAKQALRMAEALARQLGCQEMRLQLFGHNAIARTMYDGLGFRIMSMELAKLLPAEQRQANDFQRF
jgi:ribosomal protein S18 acetylase RimI-like enzyme